MLPDLYRQYGAIEDVVRRIVGDHFGVQGATLGLNTHIRDDLGADSLDFLELIMTVEELFQVRIPEADTARIERIGDIVAILERVLPRRRH